jgi:putative membrane protein
MKILEINTMLKGIAMGIAEIIPGVSGGTIAFITGIYERLMRMITSFNLSFLKLLRKGEWKLAFESIDFPFIVSLGCGMFAGIVFGIFTISHLLIHYPEPLWGFFFGLIIASILFIAKQYKVFTISAIISILIGFFIAYSISILSPVEGSDSYIFIFISGIIAISAMLLPGISGSFILVLMGMYSFILSSVKLILTDFDFKAIGIISVFVLGLIAGAATFSRIFSWLFLRYKDITLALLTGFLMGSLVKIWPWRNVTKIFDKEKNQFVDVTDGTMFSSLEAESFKVISESPVWPDMYWGNAKVILTIVVFVLGFLLVYSFDFFKKGKT